MRVLVVAISTLLIAVASAAGAGAVAIFGPAQWAIGLLVLEEVCLVFSVAVLLVLGVGKLQRRNNVVSSVRQQRAARPPR
jgi:hypothetical protein